MAIRKTALAGVIALVAFVLATASQSRAGCVPVMDGEYDGVSDGVCVNPLPGDVGSFEVTGCGKADPKPGLAVLISSALLVDTEVLTTPASRAVWQDERSLGKPWPVDFLTSWAPSSSSTSLQARRVGGSTAGSPALQSAGTVPL